MVVQMGDQRLLPFEKGIVLKEVFAKFEVSGAKTTHPLLILSLDVVHRISGMPSRGSNYHRGKKLQ